MTKLELINKEIEDVKDYLKDYKKYHLKSKRYTPERLVLLEQIKQDLKAWEVAKEELQIVFKGKNYYGEPLHRYELNIIGQNKIDTLNKAMEVENEKED